MDKVGFIILRHVNNAREDMFWIDSYRCLRELYPENKIVIIDSQSDKRVLTNMELYKTEIIESEYPNRGEVLPYYYFLKYHWFDTAVVIHDSVYIHKYIDFSTDTYKILWGFDYAKDERGAEALEIIHSLHNNEALLSFYNQKEKWKGCLGSMSVITFALLEKIHNAYNLDNILNVIITKKHREAFERVWGCLLQLEGPAEFSISQDIFTYLPYGIPFEVRNHYSHLSAIKTWNYR